MDSRVKVESSPTSSSSVDDVKREILNLVRAYESGITEAELSNTMLNTSMESRRDAINALTNEGKIQLYKRGSDLIYRASDEKTTLNHANLKNANISIEERAVLQVIERAGNVGIWNREIRCQTKLPLNQMMKILKNLETKKLIKAVKSVTASKKKLYMSYDAEPDKSVTGGAWYSGTEFESEYVQILYEQCYQFVKKRLVTSDNFVESRDKSLVSSKEVKEHIDKLEISTAPLDLGDIEMVLETIVFDGLIEKITVINKPDVKMTPIKREKALTSDEEDQESNSTHFFRALAKFVDTPGVMKAPCGQCPLVHECRSDAVINPEKCQYIENWFTK